MKPVEEGSLLTLHYRVAAQGGDDLINTFGMQPATLTLGSSGLAPEMEARLKGLCEGDHAVFDLPAREAYGDRVAERVRHVPRALLQTLGAEGVDFQVGDMVQFPVPDRDAAFGGRIVDIEGGALRIDFNHPLAGQAVLFEVQIIHVL